MRNALLRITNPLLLLLLLFQLATALTRTRSYAFFSRWHPRGGYALVVVGAVHIVLNRKWFAAAYRSSS
jgi:hypothetical protein